MRVIWTHSSRKAFSLLRVMAPCIQPSHATTIEFEFFASVVTGSPRSEQTTFSTQREVELRQTQESCQGGFADRRTISNIATPQVLKSMINQWPVSRDIGKVSRTRFASSSPMARRAMNARRSQAFHSCRSGNPAAGFSISSKIAISPSFVQIWANGIAAVAWT